MLKGLKISCSKNYSNVSLPAKLKKIYGMNELVGLQLFWSGTPTFSSGTPTFCQMGVLNSCFQNPSESSVLDDRAALQPGKSRNSLFSAMAEV